MRSPILLFAAFFGAACFSCVDASKLTAYACDSNGRCSALVNPVESDGGTEADGGVAQSGCTPACTDTERCIDARCVDTASLTANGLACNAASECRSGFCADGFCCNTACNGACDSCGEISARGTCTFSRIGEVGTPSCSPFLCSDTSGACAASCDSAANCAAGFVCDASKQCVPKKETGVACGAGSECKSGFCSDSVCCESACAGNCDSCNSAGSVGQCKPVGAGVAGNPACPGGVVCNGSAADCPIACGAGQPACPSGYFCNPANMLCSTQRDNGTACGAGSECKSAQCVDGVCCNNACGGACDACSVAQGASADGTCSLVGQRRVCRPAAGACDIAESCGAASPDCPADLFQPQGGSPCGPSQGDCDVAEVCTGTSAACPVNALKPGGTPCRSANGVCDAAEVCTGSSSSCPADGFFSSATVCGPAQACYVSARCGGNSRDCPANTASAVGTACSGGVCNGSGTCNPCSQGSMCGSQSECVGLFTNCANGAAECTLAQNLGSGTPCTVGGVNGTCNGSGTCVTCTPGGSCDTGNECTQGTYVCQGTTRVCQASPKAAGVGCSIGVCNGSGACVACTSGQACGVGDVCRVGMISCSTGAPKCIDVGFAAAGTNCGTPHEQCDGQGNCLCQGCTIGGSCGEPCTGIRSMCCPGAGCQLPGNECPAPF